MIDPRYADLNRFFSDRAMILQKAVDYEIKKAGGEGKLSARDDLNHRVYDAREQIKLYYTICRMLEEKALGMDTAKYIQSLQPNIPEERHEIERMERKQEEEARALRELRSEAEYYRQALEVLGG